MNNRKASVGRRDCPRRRSRRCRWGSASGAALARPLRGGVRRMPALGQPPDAIRTMHVVCGEPLDL